MHDMIESTLALIQEHPTWAIWLIFLVTLGESMFVLGILIPGTSVLLVCGGLLGSGFLPVLPVVIAGIVGAALGDGASYWIGRWGGTAILRIPPLRKHRRNIAKARLFFRRYGFASIFLGRFMGPIRCSIPTVAGALKMGHWPFQWANILSAVLWVPVLLAPGYFGAESILPTLVK